MKMRPYTRNFVRKIINVLSVFLALAVINVSVAQTLINYDRLSFFETPQRVEIGTGTLQLQGALDISYRSENDGLAEFDSQQAEAFLRYETQLENDWDVGISYRINYDTNRADSTVDELRIFARDQWGLLTVGNISSLLYDQSRRQLANGLLGVDRDNFTLPLDEYGVFYQWATADTQWMLAVDNDVNIEAGVVFNKPIGRLDYKFSMRANSNENIDGDAQNVTESQGLAIVAQASIGRWTVDSQWMTEQVQLLDGSSELTLNTLSMGLHAKFNLLSLSLTGMQRDNELSDTERSLSLGVRYDIARGLSLNLGANIFSTELINNDFSSYAASIGYQF